MQAVKLRAAIYSGRDPSGLNEAWIVSYVGIFLNDLLRKRFACSKGIFVSFETTVDYVDCCFGRDADHWLKYGQRFDMLLWSEVLPFALVEVKHGPYLDEWNVKNDASKIVGALERWEGLQEAYFIFSSSGH